MVRLLRYLIFLSFNISYRDGNVKVNSTPRADATCILTLYEYLAVIPCIYLLSQYLDFSLISNVLKPLDSIVYGWGMLMCAIVYPINYYYFVRKGWLDRIYMEFKGAQINTKTNQMIGYTCLILYMSIMIGVIGHLKYWFP